MSKTNVEVRKKHLKVLVKWDWWWNPDFTCACTMSLNFESCVLGGVPMGNWFRFYFRQLFISFSFKKIEKKTREIPKIILIQDFFQKPEFARFSIGFCLTAPFNNMWTLKFKAWPTYACFATVNQTVFGGSFQLPTTRERAVIKSLCTVQTKKQCSAVALSWEEPPNIWLTAAKTHLSVDLWILEYAWYWKAQ